MSEAQKRTLPKEAVEQLKEWLYDHLFHPYPSDAQKNQLSNQTSLEMKSINNWFINARRRLVRPLLDKVLAAYKKSNPNTPRNKDNDLIRELSDEGKLGTWARSVSSSGHSIDMSNNSSSGGRSPPAKSSRPRRTRQTRKVNVESDSESEDEVETEDDEDEYKMDVDEDTSTTNDEQSDMSYSESEFEIENEDVQAANTLVKIKMTVDFDS
ncbi:predicted protein [Naegleria gruberi]|uniref:Predicted protein n=1 Tax=Naegleria gruberi TaxID=5762 RepID=D2VXT2_NAEGR|nr:uncharacterized protein NAEGRDRAFT_73864 [Naegleria gruberi]EFC38393.1 predicted protein [Naegleria gruberi]|eukprot:XP_002671137.1 predicted protein [Naegleria gruberi strain NEG-M]